MVGFLNLSQKHPLIGRYVYIVVMNKLYLVLNHAVFVKQTQHTQSQSARDNLTRHLFIFYKHLAAFPCRQQFQ
jgi:phage-related protein